MRGQQRFSRRVRRALRYYYLRLVRIDDSPEKIARGVALGVFLGVFPTFGLGLILAVVLASRMHANKAAALLGSVIMNPFTAPLFWALSAAVGAAAFGVDREAILEVARDFESNWAHLFGWLGLAYVVGNVIVSVACTAVAFFLTRRVAEVVHDRRRERRHRRTLRRAEKQMGADVRPGA
jgi:uncharacterized protein